jgi:O-antigen/teichoic acid export membrane protein
VSTRYASFVLLPLAFGLCATATPALTLFAGMAYVRGGGPLMILAGTYAFASVATAAGLMLLALGETRLSSLSSMATVAVSLETAWILTPVIGMFGAAAARGVGMIGC